MRRGARVTALDYSAADLKDVAAVSGAMIEAGEMSADQWAGGGERRRARPAVPHGSFDRVIVSEVLEHIWDDERALVEIVRVLRPGGRVAATVPTAVARAGLVGDQLTATTTSPAPHVRIYRQHELEQKLERGGLLPAGLAPRARVPLAVLVAEVRVRPRQPRRRAGEALPRLLVPPHRAQPAAGPRSPSARSTPCSARASSSTARRSRPARSAGSAALAERVLPEVAGIITAAQVAETVDAIASVQQPDGNIPWVPGGQTDPWNLVEAAMALDVGGRFERGRALPTSGCAARSTRADRGTRTTRATR